VRSTPHHSDQQQRARSSGGAGAKGSYGPASARAAQPPAAAVEGLVEENPTVVRSSGGAGATGSYGPPTTTTTAATATRPTATEGDDERQSPFAAAATAGDDGAAPVLRPSAAAAALVAPAPIVINSDSDSTLVAHARHAVSSIAERVAHGALPARAHRRFGGARGGAEAAGIVDGASGGTFGVPEGEVAKIAEALPPEGSPLADSALLQEPSPRDECAPDAGSVRALTAARAARAEGAAREVEEGRARKDPVSMAAMMWEGDLGGGGRWAGWWGSAPASAAPAEQALTGFSKGELVLVVTGDSYAVAFRLLS